MFTKWLKEPFCYGSVFSISETGLPFCIRVCKWDSRWLKGKLQPEPYMIMVQGNNEEKSSTDEWVKVKIDALGNIKKIIPAIKFRRKNKENLYYVKHHKKTLAEFITTMHKYFILHYENENGLSTLELFNKIQEEWVNGSANI